MRNVSTIARTVLITAALLGLVAPAAAQDATAAERCDQNPDTVYCLCRDGNRPPPASAFPEVRESALALRSNFCGGLLAEDAVRNLVFDFLSAHEGWATRFGGFEGGGSPNQLLLSISRAAQAPQALNDPRVRDERVVLRVGDQFFTVADTEACAALAGSSGGAADRCEAVVQEYVDLYAYAQKTFAAFSEYAFARNIRTLRGEWDAYFESARGMTTLELALNSYLHRKDETTKFAGPPRRQWVLLHPEIVIEQVRGAADGEETDEALALELVGLNYWDQRGAPWYRPSGGSVTLLYSDKASTDDLGIGFQLYFRSAYSIGYSNRGGEDGVFVSVDLLKLFRDRRNELSAFLD